MLILMSYAKKQGKDYENFLELHHILIFQRDTYFLNALFMSQFSYCPLVWMCHRRPKIHKINRLHKSYLRIIYCDKNYTFKE